MQDAKIILEGLDGPHNLKCGDFYLDETNEVMYVGIGSFGSGGGGIIPVGTIHINTNGNYNVTNYASANVDVPPYGVGTMDIDHNGKVNVSGIKTAIVNVPQNLNTNPYLFDLEIIPPKHEYFELPHKTKYNIDITVTKL